jgi:hypothetical protein
MPLLKKKRTALTSIENVIDESTETKQTGTGTKGAHITAAEKSVLCNIRKFFQKVSNSEIILNKNQVIKNTSMCSGFSESSVKRFTKGCCEEDDYEESVCDGNIGRPSILLDNFFKDMIRRKVHEFYINKTYPTANNIYEEMCKEDDFPKMSETTFLRIMKSIGFQFKKLNSKSVCFEAPRIASMRHAFLRDIKRLRALGYKIHYTDETWAGANHTMKYGWLENVNDMEQFLLDFDYGRIQNVDGWKGGFKVPSGAGKRTIILAIGSDDGFLEPLEETALVFEGKKGSADYHDEMNWKHFSEWFRKVLEYIPEKSVVVIDRAPYHTVQSPETKNPNSSWRKDDIIDWLVSHSIEPQLNHSRCIMFCQSFFFYENFNFNFVKYLNL